MQFKNGIGGMAVPDLMPYSEDSREFHTGETYFPVSEIRALHLGRCGVEGGGLKKMTAHTHEKHEGDNADIVCIETPALAQLLVIPQQFHLDFMSDVVGHEIAHVLMGERCRCEHETPGDTSEGHGANWQIATKTLGFSRAAKSGCKDCAEVSARYPSYRPLPGILRLAEYLLTQAPRAIAENREDVAQEEIKARAFMQKMAAKQGRRMPHGMPPPFPRGVRPGPRRRRG